MIGQRQMNLMLTNRTIRGFKAMDEEKKLKLRNELKVALYIFKEGLYHLEEAIKAYYELIDDEQVEDDDLK